jgi:hypothetical protein
MYTLDAIAIDPREMTVEPIGIEVDDSNGSYQGLRKALGFTPDQHFDSVTLTNVHSQGRLVMWLDDEGLFVEPQFFFSFGLSDRMFAGRAVITRVDNEGETRGIPFRDEFMALVESTIVWRPVTYAGAVTTEGEVDHPLFGKTHQIRSEARFRDRKPRQGEHGWSTATDAPPGAEG